MNSDVRYVICRIGWFGKDKVDDYCTRNTLEEARTFIRELQEDPKYKYECQFWIEARPRF